MQPEQIDYSIQKVENPHYGFSKLLPQTGSTTATITTSGGSDFVIECPVGVYNLAQSILDFEISCPAQTNHVFTYTDTVPEFRQVQLYTRDGKFLADISECANFMHTVNKALISNSEMDTFDDGYNGGKGTLQGLRPCNIVIGGTSSIEKNVFRPDGTSVNKSIQETEYVCSSAQGGALTLRYRIPLAMIKHSIFEVDKDISFNQAFLFRVVFNPSIKCYWANGGDSMDPVSGTEVVATGSITMTNICLNLAREENPIIRENVIRQSMSAEGMKYLIDYVWTQKQSLSGTSQSVILRANKAQGLRLKRIYHTLYNSAETINTSFDHSELLGTTRISSYYTNFNSRREQDQNIDLTKYDDYVLHKKLLEGSCLMSANIYQFNWVHIADYCNNSKPLWEQEIGKNNRVEGFDLSKDVEWNFYATTASATNMHHSFIVVQRELIINKDGVFLI